jgi:hypothetical protein
MKALGSLFKSITGGSSVQKPSLFSGVSSKFYEHNLGRFHARKENILNI